MAPTLLSMPLEIRHLIYEHLFRTHTIRHGFASKEAARSETPNSNAAAHTRTALFLTCSQTYAESRAFLPQFCTFHFRTTEALLNTLLPIPQEILTRIRHIVLSAAFPFPLYSSGRADFYSIYHFANALSLLPGLNLDVLEVRDVFHGAGMGDAWRDLVTYLDVEQLLARSEGWRTLVYRTACADFLTGGVDRKAVRVRQPQGWNEVVQRRDGRVRGSSSSAVQEDGNGAETVDLDKEEAIEPDTTASVKMYITPDRGPDRGKTREWSAIPGHEVVQNWRLGGGDQDLQGEVMIVAKRGRRASVVQTGFRGRGDDGRLRTWRDMKGEDGEFKAPEGGF